MTVFADLHVHTENSDGVFSLSEIPTAARDAGVGAVAVTDHDRLHPDLSTPVSVLAGVTVVHGIELRVETSDGRVDLLGYGVSPTPALDAELERLQEDRVERARTIVERIEAECDVELDVDLHPGVGRPHIAHAIEAHPDIPYDFSGAFEHLIGGNGPCYVARDVTPFEDAVPLLQDACGLVSLAHPHRYSDLDHALDLARELDGIERQYPYDRPVDNRRIDAVIDEHDLVATGGSDAHDRTLGRAGLSKSEYRRFRSAVRP